MVVAAAAMTKRAVRFGRSANRKRREEEKKNYYIERERERDR